MGAETRIEIDDRGVATLWLDRADKHNAMSARMIEELHAAALALGDDDAVRVVVLAAEGRTFCAGGDLAWMRAQMAADAATRRGAATALAAMLGALNDMPKPLIGRVHANAFGGGVGLMAVCDTVFAARSARFALTETRLGLIPATIGPYVLTRIGASQARQVFMSSRSFDVERAMALGLVAEVAEAEALEATVADEVAAYLDCAPGAVAAAKALALSQGAAVDPAAISESIDALVAQWEGEEAREGVAAFFEKRSPSWHVSG